DASVVQPVYASPEAGTVPIGTEVTLETRTDGAEIYYTLDGSDPSENGVLYDGPISIETDVTIKTIAQKEDLAPSVVTEFSYTVYDADDGIQIHHIQGESQDRKSTRLNSSHVS